MPHNLASNVFTLVEDSMCQAVAYDNGRVKSAPRQIATGGYWIQSHVLRIPDRFGFFSSGPPQLQVYQGALFGFLAVHVAISALFGALIVWWIKRHGRPVTTLVRGMAAMWVAMAAVIWVSECVHPHRGPDYVWPGRKGPEG